MVCPIMSTNHAYSTYGATARTPNLAWGSLLLLAACSASVKGSGDPQHDDADDDAGVSSLEAGALSGADAGVGRCGEDGDDRDDHDNPPIQQCEDYSVEVKSAVANVLIVLDRSGSMRDLTVN